MRRRHFLYFTLAFCGITTTGRSDDEPSGSVNPQPSAIIADLEQTLKSGLRARRQLEFDFIHMVVLKVKTKEIPIDLVQSTFNWARKRGRYPYPYFARGLRERASRIGITI